MTSRSCETQGLLCWGLRSPPCASRCAQSAAQENQPPEEPMRGPSPTVNCSGLLCNPSPFLSSGSGPEVHRAGSCLPRPGIFLLTWASSSPPRHPPPRPGIFLLTRASSSSPGHPPPDPGILLPAWASSSPGHPPPRRTDASLAGPGQDRLPRQLAGPQPSALSTSPLTARFHRSECAGRIPEDGANVPALSTLLRASISHPKNRASPTSLSTLRFRENLTWMVGKDFLNCRCCANTRWGLCV